MDSHATKQGDIEAKDQEIASLRKKVTEVESQLVEAQKLIQKHLMEANEVDLLKMRSADTLTKAKSVIFENTKMIKNQELQIEALSKQVESLRDVVKITKDLLEIRNLEVDQLEAKIHCMEEKHKAEKERQDLMHQRLEQMIRHNGELKREYEAQLCLFQALRQRYDERELAKDVVDSLKEDIQKDKQQQSEQKQNDVASANNQKAIQEKKQELNGIEKIKHETEENTKKQEVQDTQCVNKPEEHDQVGKVNELKHLQISKIGDNTEVKTENEKNENILADICSAEKISAPEENNLVAIEQNESSVLQKEEVVDQNIQS